MQMLSSYYTILLVAAIENCIIVSLYPAHENMIVMLTSPTGRRKAQHICPYNRRV